MSQCDSCKNCSICKSKEAVNRLEQFGDTVCTGYESNMTYKEFKRWCNERCCDGLWGLNVAKACIDALSHIGKKPFWKREKAWQELNRNTGITLYVHDINTKIVEALRRETK
jgi:hypothetical protein